MQKTVTERSPKSRKSLQGLVFVMLYLSVTSHLCMYYHIIYAAFRINQVQKKEATCCTMLTFPEISFPSPSLATPWFVFMLEQTSSARALCEDFRHFLSMPSITGHTLCEDFPIFLFGGIGAPGIWQRKVRISRNMVSNHTHIRTGALWSVSSNMAKNGPRNH